MSGIPTQLQLTPSMTPVKAYQTFAISVALTAGDPPTAVAEALVSLTIDNEVYEVTVLDGHGSTPDIQLPAGSYTVSASYAGNDEYKESNAVDTQEVERDDVTGTITVEPLNPTVGDQVQISINVQAASTEHVVDGNVQLMVDNIPVGDAQPLDNGSYSTNYIFTTAGNIQVKFEYLGSNDYNPKDFTETVQVQAIPTTLSIGVSPESSWIGQSTELQFTVTPENNVGPINGTITVTIGNNAPVALAVTDGSAIINYAFSGPPGPVTISAIFAPETDSPYGGSENEVDHEVELIPTETVLTLTPENSSMVGQNIAFKATVKDANNLPVNDGTVTFYYDGGTLYEGEVVNGELTYDNAFIPAGEYVFRAVYSANDVYAESEDSQNYVVERRDVTITLTAEPTQTTEGNPIAFSVQVSPVDPDTQTPSGTVIFYDGDPSDPGNQIGSTSLNPQGEAEFSYSELAVGSHTIRAVYVESSRYNTATSDQVVVEITQTPREPTNTTIVQDNSSSMFGASVTFTATVTAQNEGVDNPTSGPVTFYRDGISIGDENLDEANTALITTNTLPPGIHDITAYYGGNNEYDESTSDPIQHKVQAATVTTVTPNPLSPSSAGQEVTFTITVRTSVESSYIPQGEVRLYIDGAGLGSATLNGEGNASFQHTFEEVGTYTYHAEFLGDDIYLPSESDSAQYVTYALPTELTLTSNYNPSWYGQMVTFTAQVDPAQQGVVSFTIEGNQYGPVLVGENGTAQLKIATLAPGYHQVVAAFTGDGITLTANLRQVVYYCCRN